ncbi:hypothetical protein BD770DRAFT_478137 [Pilaira anomala]|nr:hypothetical protein BD770DRAFT_478137 [Pilaira anomala]
MSQNNNSSKASNTRKGKGKKVDGACSKVSWNNDEAKCDVLVNSTPMTSMQVLMSWLTQPGNIASYRGGKEKKSAVIARVETYFKSMGITHRDQKSISNKLSHMLNLYREASIWLNSSGQGILDTSVHADEPEGSVNAKAHETIRSYVLGLCPEFYELQPFYGDSAGAEANPSHESDDEHAEEFIFGSNDSNNYSYNSNNYSSSNKGSSSSSKKRPTTIADLVESANVDRAKKIRLEERRLVIEEEKMKIMRSGYRIDLLQKAFDTNAKACKVMHDAGALTTGEFRDEMKKLLDIFNEHVDEEGIRAVAEDNRLSEEDRS